MSMTPLYTTEQIYLARDLFMSASRDPMAAGSPVMKAAEEVLLSVMKPTAQVMGTAVEWVEVTCMHEGKAVQRTMLARVEDIQAHE